MGGSAFQRTVIAVGLVFAGTATQPAYSAGFALSEQNVSGLGNAYAGAAAVAEDASTVWWNPAGMSKLRAGRQVALGATYIQPSTRFTDTGTTVPAPRALGGDGGNAGQAAGVPFAYFTTDAGTNIKFGVGLSVPFGLATEYDPAWTGRFQGIKAKIQSQNLNPSVSLKVSEALSLGAGVNWQQFKAELSSAVNFGAAGEGSSVIKGDGDALGYNVGALYDIAPRTRLGLAYRSMIRQKLSGSVNFSRPAAVPAAAAPDGIINLNVDLPDTYSVALAHELSPQWQLLADATQTGWSRIQNLVIFRDTGAPLSTLALNFRNTMRYALGVNYRPSDKWIMRGGVALDQSPVKDAQSRTVRLPDNDRIWFSLGAKYRFSEGGSVDFGYSYLKVRDSSINNSFNSAVVGTVNGNYKEYVNIAGLQYTRDF